MRKRKKEQEIKQEDGEMEREGERAGEGNTCIII